MARRKQKNPSFVIRDANYSLYMNAQSFGPMGACPGHSNPQLAKLDTNEADEYGQLVAIHVDLRFCGHLYNRMLDQHALAPNKSATRNFVTQLRIRPVTRVRSLARFWESFWEFNKKGSYKIL